MKKSMIFLAMLFSTSVNLPIYAANITNKERLRTALSRRISQSMPRTSPSAY